MLGIAQPKLSKMLPGQFRGFSAHPLTDRIALRAPGRRLQYPDPQPPDRLVEVSREDAFAIVKQEFVLISISDQLSHLL